MLAVRMTTLRRTALLLWLALALPAGAAEPPTPDAAEPTPISGPKSSASKVNCDRWLAMLTGARKAEAEKMGSSDVQSILHQVPDLVTCKAVEADSAELCDLEGSGGDKCRETVAAFHELRANPKGRGFLMTPEEMKNCRREPEMAPYCDQIRVAALAGDPKQCPPGTMEKVCQAYISLDKKDCDVLSAYEGEQEECVKQIERKLGFAKGLPELAKSGSERERALARAALGKADACGGYQKKATEVCLGRVSRPTDKAVLLDKPAAGSPK